jgi:uncharacterized membrane protein
MNKTHKMVLNALMIALVCVGTMIIQIPMPATNGYVNIGDGIIFISAIVFGPIPGMIAGGIGSSLADILSGYSQWAIFTLIIKGLEGYVVGIIVRQNVTKTKSIIASIIGSIIMIGGYYIAGGILEGSFIVSLHSIPGNAIQALASIIIGVPLAISLNKIPYFKKTSRAS